jgi:hypothetical protein
MGIMTLRRAKAIIGVMFGAALFFGFLVWYIYGDTGLALSLIVEVAAVIILSLGFYD